jgi:F420-non-reducing hydrogenase small subunit
MSNIASSVAAQTPDETRRILSGIPDPVGTLYRYSLPKSLLRGVPPIQTKEASQA